MRNKFLKGVIIFLISIIVISTMFYTVNADYSSQMSSLITDASSNNGKLSKDDTGTADTVGNMTGIIISVVRIIGVTIAIVMLLTVAMKYMTAAPGEKADIKKSAIGYVVGAIVLFAVTGILGIIQQFASNV